LVFGNITMEDRPAQPETEAELEAFRQRWREEVSARNKRPEETVARPQAVKQKPVAPTAAAGPSTARRKVETDYDEIAPKPYHDLPDKEEHLKLGEEGQNYDRTNAFREPSTAIEHYERAVEKETHGQLGDSLKHYRKAFKVGYYPLLNIS
jgi:F-box protein 9